MKRPCLMKCVKWFLVTILKTTRGVKPIIRLRTGVQYDISQPENMPIKVYEIGLYSKVSNGKGIREARFSFPRYLCINRFWLSIISWKNLFSSVILFVMSLGSQNLLEQPTKIVSHININISFKSFKMEPNCANKFQECLIPWKVEKSKCCY